MQISTAGNTRGIIAIVLSLTIEEKREMSQFLLASISEDKPFMMMEDKYNLTVITMEEE